MDDLAIETRIGLPQHLRILAERYPRGEWSGHTNFNELTRFWLDRHLMFRELQAKLGEEAQLFLDGKLEVPTYGNRLYRYASMFINNLHGHHQIEDAHYFPMLVAHERRLQQGFEMLDADHHALLDLLETMTGEPMPLCRPSWKTAGQLTRWERLKNNCPVWQFPRPASERRGRAGSAGDPRTRDQG
ncbi:MAG: hemerythrin domain-containing protein [Nitratireductor sp.]